MITIEQFLRLMIIPLVAAAYIGASHIVGDLGAGAHSPPASQQVASR